MNGTFLSTETLAQYEDSADRQQCRICLQDLQGEFLPPFCECRGNHRSVHERCLREWAIRAQKFRDGRGNFYFYCDLCRTPIRIRLNRTCRMKNGKQVWQELKENFCKIGLMLIMGLFFLGVMTVSIYALLQTPQAMAVYLTLIVVSGIMASLSLPLLIIRVAFECRQVFSGFIPLGEGGSRSGLVANSYHTTQDQ